MHSGPPRLQRLVAHVSEEVAAARWLDRPGAHLLMAASVECRNQRSLEVAHAAVVVCLDQVVEPLVLAEVLELAEAPQALAGALEAWAAPCPERASSQ